MQGRCLCGAVRIDVTRYDADVSQCHCTMCRRWSGSTFACFEALPENVHATGPVKLWNSAIAERAWCGTCGSHPWMRDTIVADAPFDLMPGLFDDALSFALDREVYSDRAPAWAKFAGDHLRVRAADYENTYSFIPNGDLP
jgi:hypothetical protein